MIEVVTIDMPSLGDRACLATDGAGALVAGPQQDTGRVLAVAAARGVPVMHVLETHIHHDYVSGGLALARRRGAAYHVNAADAVAFGRVRIADGDTVAARRSMRVRVIATPGHSFTHLTYAVMDAATGAVAAVVTGGSLLHGSTGRVASLLRAAGRTVTAVDDDFGRAAAAGLTVAGAPRRPAA